MVMGFFDLRSKSMYLRSKYVYVVNTEVAKETKCQRQQRQ